jgi:hypothetical protein
MRKSTLPSPVKMEYSRALRCTFFGELKSSCSSKSCIIRSMVCNTVFKNKKSVLLKVSTSQQVFVYLKYTQCAKTCKNVQKRAKRCKNVHLKYLFIKNRASQVLIYQKTCKIVQKPAKTCKNVHLKCFSTLFKNVHCQGPCILRPCISRPYCMGEILSFLA